MNAPLTLLDIPWLRRAESVAGASEVPPSIAARLIGGRLVERDAKRGCLKITTRGKLALTRLVG